MNHTLKAIITAVALIFTGAVLAGCGLLGMNGTWDMLTGSTAPVTTQETITGDFTNIDINILWADLEILPSTDGTCHYIAKTYDSMFCSAEVENGTLKIGQDDNRKWYQHIGINWDTTSLKLYLPKDAYDQLTILGRTSDVTIPNDFTFENAQITTSTGDVVLNCQVAKQLNVTCSTGHITVRDTSSETITAAVSTGDIKLARITCDSLSTSTSTGFCRMENVAVAQNLSATSNTGGKYLTNVTCGSLNMKATTGDTELTNVVVSGDARLQSSTGDWTFDRFDAANITMNTDTGDVEGTFLSEKIFFVDTDTGDVVVPRTTTGGTCQITTDTGDIEIDIVP